MPCCNGCWISESIVMSEEKLAAGPAFARLVEIMAKLRAPGGCPWDREQSFRET